MNKIFIKTGILTISPFIINLIVSTYVKSGPGYLEFIGYFNGAMTSFILSLVWLIMVRISMLAETVNLLKIMIRGFVVKFILLVLCVAVTFFYFEFDRRYFVISFCIGTLSTLIVEVWFYLAMDKLGKMKRAGQINN